jgi:hypothetical protein
LLFHISIDDEDSKENLLGDNDSQTANSSDQLSFIPDSVPLVSTATFTDEHV